MQYFKNTIIQDKVKQSFVQTLSSQRLSHAYLFYGNEGSGKTAFALELSKAVNCQSSQEKPCNECPPCIKINHFNHPDIRYIFPLSSHIKTDKIAELTKKKAQNPYKAEAITGSLNIAIEEIRKLKDEAKFAPYEAKKRVFILENIEYFSREAANSFLKLLEEPPGNLLLILTTNDINALLDTVLSRCHLIRFSPLSDDQIKQIVGKYTDTLPNDITALIRISQNNTKRLFQLLDEDYKQKRESVYHFLKSIVAANYSNVSNMVESQTRKKNKSDLLEILDLLTLWFYDSLHYIYTENTEDFINVDIQDSIRKFAAAYQNSDFDNLIEIVDFARQKIDGNANPALTLTNMVIQINENLVRSSFAQKER
jgi:DNA polymerase-3 subunit delta'